MAVKKNISPMIKTSIVSSIIMLTFKLYAFLKQMVIAGYYGISSKMDIYSLTKTVINNPLAIVSEALFVTVVSQYTYARVCKGKDKSDNLISSIIILIALLASLYAGIIAMFSEPLADLLSKGKYTGELWNTLKYCICLMAVYSAVFTLTSVLGAVSESHKKFILPRMESFINSSVVIVMTVLFAKVYYIKSLIWADVIAITVYLFIQLYILKSCFTFRFPIWDWKEIKQIMWLMFPLIWGNASYRINQMVDTFLASRFDGGAAVLGYSHVLEQLITVTLGTSLGNILFSFMAELSAKNQKEIMDQSTKQMFRVCLLVTIPISFISIAKAFEIVKIIFFRGSFDAQAVNLTVGAFSGYAIGFTFTVMKNLLTKYLYAQNNTKVPALLGILSAIGNIVLSIQLSKNYRIDGITYATSIMSIFSMIFLAVYINKKYMKMITRCSILFVAKIVMSGIGASLFSAWIKVLHLNELLDLFFFAISYMFVFFLLAYFMKIDEVHILIGLLKINRNREK